MAQEHGYRLDPSIPVIGYTEMVTNEMCISHSHPRGQLIYATRGVMNVVVGNHIWVVNPLQGLWLPGGVEHQVTFQKDVNYYSVFIDPSAMEGLPENSFSFDIPMFLKQLVFKIISFGIEGNLTPPQHRIISVFLDELALIEALNSGKVSFAGLDVFDNEPTPNEAILAHPKISLTPHIGAATNEAQANIGLEIADRVIAFFGDQR